MDTGNNVDQNNVGEMVLKNSNSSSENHFRNEAILQKPSFENIRTFESDTTNTK